MVSQWQTIYLQLRGLGSLGVRSLSWDVWRRRCRRTPVWAFPGLVAGRFRNRLFYISSIRGLASHLWMSVPESWSNRCPIKHYNGNAIHPGLLWEIDLRLLGTDICYRSLTERIWTRQGLCTRHGRIKHTVFIVNRDGTGLRQLIEEDGSRASACALSPGRFQKCFIHR